MRALNLRTATVALVAGLGLGGCAYGPYGGLGVGVGYGNAGYGTAGYGGGYCDPYYDRYCSSYGYSSYGSPYGYSPYGWHDGYYYPGTGYYVYDSYRRPYRWSDAQRRYWQDRSRYYGGTPSAYWGDFERRDRDRVRIVRKRDSGGVISQVLRPRYTTVDGQSSTAVESGGVQTRSVTRVRRSDTATSDDGVQSSRGERRRSGVRIKRVRDDD
ncbi:MAG TPA: hypothetical protein VFK58_04215 [Sphingomicrobium sp.]|nr:hypothetical protein [Sphingomicrobium sp.]